jgi:hypothetical protein
MNTLFNASLTEKRENRSLFETKTTQIAPRSFELNEEGVSLTLTVVDTPGFGDQMDRSKEYVLHFYNNLPSIASHLTCTAMHSFFTSSFLFYTTHSFKWIGPRNMSQFFNVHGIAFI